MKNGILEIFLFCYNTRSVCESLLLLNCCYFLVDEHCVLNHNATNISTLVYAGISFLSFLLLVPTVVLSVIIYFKRKVVMEHMEGLFLTLAVIMLSLSFNESFQWVLFCSSVGCEVVGFIREFCLISLLSNTSCIGFHLLLQMCQLQMCQPKCLHVIDEVRRRRSRILAVVYLILVILIPLLFVFWPFLKNGKYGNDSSFCWISNEFHSPWYIRILLWHIWALLICAFTLLVSLLVVARLCLRAAKCNADIFTLLLLMIGFLYAVVMFGLSAVLGNSSYLPSAGVLDPLHSCSRV